MRREDEGRSTNTKDYDSLIVVSFGGPEGMDEVMPFLENVTRGRNIPRERLESVAQHYYLFDGVSPINAQNRELIADIHAELQRQGIDLPIYFGNRNWKPFLTDTLGEMKADGRKRALGFFTSLFSCYSGCRQYRENIQAAQREVPGSPDIDKIRMGFNHPGFIEAMTDRVREALSELGDSDDFQLLFTAHSIPLSMAETSWYERQLREASNLVAERLGKAEWILAWQSRSGSPQIPWLEPDVSDVLRELAASGRKRVVVAPIGFISDHMEVIYDLDHEARDTASELGMTLVRARTVGTHPKFVAGIVDLIRERLEGRAERAACGTLGPWHDVCPPGCCPSGRPSTVA